MLSACQHFLLVPPALRSVPVRATKAADPNLLSDASANRRLLDHVIAPKVLGHRRDDEGPEN